jgi:phospholipid transport system transporter-binding protein
VLTLPAELTQTQASACLRALAQSLPQEPGPCVVVDAGALQRFDSSALAVLLDLRRTALAAGKSFAVSALPRRLADLARLYGIDGLLPASAA